MRSLDAVSTFPVVLKFYRNLRSSAAATYVSSLANWFCLTSIDAVAQKLLICVMTWRLKLMSGQWLSPEANVWTVTISLLLLCMIHTQTNTHTYIYIYIHALASNPIADVLLAAASLLSTQTTLLMLIMFLYRCRALQFSNVWLC